MFDSKKTYTLPFKSFVPNYVDDFLRHQISIRSWIKFKKRQLFIKWRQQESLEIKKILSSHNCILWINISAPSLGDSLMDLSSRTMLKGRKVDLFTDKKNANLYRSDEIFRNIFTKKNEVNSSLYDLVIIDSYSSRSINIKSKVTPVTPFVGMYGYFNGPEVNRVLFSYHRLNQLISYKNSNSEILKIARSSISISISDQNLIKNEKLPSNYIAIAVGGEWKHRIYNKWEEIIRLLYIQEKNLNIILVGSVNAINTAQLILNNFHHKNIYNCVARFSFNQTAQIISQAKLLLCCDGGLMHAANAVKTPIVPLLCRLNATMQLTESIDNFSLFDRNDVNNISEIKIIQKYIEASTFVDNHPQV